jgi:hypothetical protein
MAVRKPATCSLLHPLQAPGGDPLPRCPQPVPDETVPSGIGGVFATRSLSRSSENAGGQLTTMGELVASTAREMNQPLGAIVNNANSVFGSPPGPEIRMLCRKQPSIEMLKGTDSQAPTCANRSCYDNYHNVNMAGWPHGAQRLRALTQAIY